MALVALFSVTLTAAHAAGGTNSLPVNLKYLGTANQAPIFELTFTNEKVAEFEITVTDKDNIIYAETVKGKGLVRKYQFVNNDVNTNVSADDEIIVVVKNTITKEVITYKIHPASPSTGETELVGGL